LGDEEAMGFGDVTLMGMIGTFLGWHASLLAFFLAPMAAILIVLVQRTLDGRAGSGLWSPHLSGRRGRWWPWLAERFRAAAEPPPDACSAVGFV